MSDNQVKMKVRSLIKESGFTKTEELLCPIAKIIHMRYNSVPLRQAMKAAGSVLRE